MKNIVQTIIQSICVLAVLLLTMQMSGVFAAVMNSSNYSIQSDSLNFGGANADSASYTLEDTLGEVATGDSDSASYRLHAGYQQMHEVYLAMTSLADVTMSPSLGGLSGGTSNGSTATTITTDSPAGYELYFKASSSPAMKGDTQGDSIANYTPAGSDPDYDFTVPVTAAEFGFTPEGADIASEYRDNGSACNTGSGDTADKCWNPITTLDELISRRTSSNHPSGTATTLKFRVTVGTSSFKLEDSYTATTTLTLLPL